MSTILATIRSQQEIALLVASSDISVTLLEGGRTLHLALKFPLHMQTNTKQPKPGAINILTSDER